MHKIIRLHAVKEITGLARSTIYKKMKEESFPNQISLGPKSVGWLESSVQEWINQQISNTQRIV